MRQQWRQWSFVLSLWLPLCVGALIAWAMSRGQLSDSSRTVAVWDGTGRWLRRLHELLAARSRVLYPLVPQDTVMLPELLRRVATGQWEAVLWLESEPSGAISVRLWGRVSSAADVQGLLESLEHSMRRELLQGSPPAGGVAPLHVWQVYWLVGSLGQQMSGQTMAVIGIVILGTVLVWAARVATEERFTRVAEFVLSFATAQEVVWGKFLSVVAVGICQLCVLGVLGYAAGVEMLPMLVPTAVGCAFLVALGLTLAFWARSEAHLHGMLTLALFCLFGGVVLAAWREVVPLLAVVPLWMPVAALWSAEGQSWRMVLGEVLTLGLTVGLLRRAALGLRRSVAAGER